MINVLAVDLFMPFEQKIALYEFGLTHNIQFELISLLGEARQVSCACVCISKILFPYMKINVVTQNLFKHLNERMDDTNLV